MIKTKYKRNAKICMLSLAVMFIAISSAQADIVPASRLTTWQGNVGIPGGIPFRNTICATISPSGGNDQPAIQAAINSCPSGQTVSLNAGTFNLSSSLSMKSNITLRGVGPSQTILKYSNGSGSGYINFLGSGNYDPPNYTTTWTAGYTKGTTVVTLSSVSNLSVGSVLFLDQTDDNSTDVWAAGNEGGAQFTRGGSTRHKIQAVSVTAINGNNVTIDPPLYGNFSSAQSPGAFWYPTMITMAGVENLKIDPSTDGSPVEDNIYIQYANAVWVKNVESYDASRAHVRALWAKSLEIRDSYFHHSRAYAQESYGMEPWFTSASLIENNIFNTLTMPLLLAVGTSGNVLAYNYSAGIRYDPTPGWLVGGTEHDGYAWMNLFEGNILQNIFLDNAWGSNGYTTIFRNNISGWQSGLVSNTYPIVFEAHSRNNNIVGNVLGTSGYHNLYEIQNTTSSSQKAIYVFGFWSSSASDTSSYDSTVYSSVLRHMNYDFATNSVKHCDTDGGPGCQNGTNDTTLPASLYLVSKPSWFGSLTWPPINPVGPVVGQIPAQVYYSTGSWPASSVLPSSPTSVSVIANNAISWVTPTLYSDSSQIIDTVTARVYCGTTSQSYTKSTIISNGVSSVSLASVNCPATGTIYYSVTATVNGSESAYSSEVSAASKWGFLRRLFRWF